MMTLQTRTLAERLGRMREGGELSSPLQPPCDSSLARATRACTCAPATSSAKPANAAKVRAHFGRFFNEHSQISQHSQPLWNPFILPLTDAAARGWCVEVRHTGLMIDTRGGHLDPVLLDRLHAIVLHDVANDPGEVVLRGELAEIEQEFMR